MERNILPFGVEIIVKIAFIITRIDDLGGAQFHILDLSLGLLREGHEVIVLGGGEGPFTEVLGCNDVPYQVLPSLMRSININRDLKAFREINRALKNFGPDLVATHSSKAGWLGRIAGRFLRIPTVFTAHGWAFTEGVPQTKRLVYAWAERIAASFAAKIITVSEYDRNLALQKKIADREKLVAIHNGVKDIPVVMEGKKPNSPPLLIMVARFSEPKDHRVLIQALAGLTHLPWKINLVGDGPLLHQTVEMAQALGLDSRVNFLGARTDVPELLAKSDIFVLVSKWEGFPMSVLEAMRAGLPVIVSDVGGSGEALEDGMNGYLIPRGNITVLQDRLCQVIQDVDLRKRMGEHSRKKFLSSFTVEQMLSKTLAVYRDVLAR